MDSLASRRTTQFSKYQEHSTHNTSHWFLFRYYFWNTSYNIILPFTSTYLKCSIPLTFFLTKCDNHFQCPDSAVFHDLITAVIFEMTSLRRSDVKAAVLTSKVLTSLLFWVFTQFRLVVSYRRLGIIYEPRSSSVKQLKILENETPIGWPETSVTQPSYFP
jgi:hypothetical protein